MVAARARLGVIGGSGMYSLLPGAHGVEVPTPFGEPSAPPVLARIGDVDVAFLPRHGPGHTLPPHRINYRANLWALASLGVERVLAPCAVGALRSGLEPGDVVICDQFIDRTQGRAATFFDGPEVAHLSAPDPYCPEVAPLAERCLRDAGLAVHRGGCVVVVDGPRFATRAESRWHAAIGGDVVNMTQCPEVVLARELGMCYTTLAVVTDRDAGVEGSPPVTQEEVFAVFSATLERLRDAVLALVDAVPAERGCDCAAARPQPLGAGSR